jgi:hypothetical protein
VVSCGARLRPPTRFRDIWGGQGPYYDRCCATGNDFQGRERLRAISSAVYSMAQLSLLYKIGGQTGLYLTPAILSAGVSCSQMFFRMLEHLECMKIVKPRFFRVTRVRTDGHAIGTTKQEMFPTIPVRTSIDGSSDLSSFPRSRAGRKPLATSQASIHTSAKASSFYTLLWDRSRLNQDPSTSLMSRYSEQFWTDIPSLERGQVNLRKAKSGQDETS